MVVEAFISHIGHSGVLAVPPDHRAMTNRRGVINARFSILRLLAMVS